MKSLCVRVFVFYSSVKQIHINGGEKEAINGEQETDVIEGCPAFLPAPNAPTVWIISKYQNTYASNWKKKKKNTSAPFGGCSAENTSLAFLVYLVDQRNLAGERICSLKKNYILT